MPTVNTQVCPICGDHDLKFSLSCTDNLTSNENFDIVRCKKCGFALTQDFPSEDVIGKYYDAPEYVSHSDTQKGVINTLYHQARRIALNSKTNLVIETSKKKKGLLLDIGCGTGYFPNSMNEAGWDTLAIEKSGSTRAYAKERFGINAYDSDFLTTIASNSLDVITMWHVLEHVENLNQTLDLIYEKLQPNGVAIIALPNKQSADAKHYKKDWAAYDVPRHLWHFSPKDFTLLANNHKFEVVKLKPMYFDGFYISMLSEQNRKTPLASLIGLFKGGIFFIQSLFDITKCSSIIYILKKKQNN